MERTLVQSSTLRSIGYDAATRALEVEFKSGALYEYSDVPKEVYDGLTSARSVGTYFAQRIKAAAYRFRKLR